VLGHDAQGRGGYGEELLADALAKGERGSGGQVGACAHAEGERGGGGALSHVEVGGREVVAHTMKEGLRM